MKILVKLGGKIIDNPQRLNKFVFEVKKLVKQKQKVVIIHGGGVIVSCWMEKLGIKPRFVDGLRVTDKEVLDIVCGVLCGLVNKNLVAKFVNSGIEKTVGISCIDGKLLVTDVDKKLGFVGRNILKVNPELLDILLKHNYIVLISTVGIGIDNQADKVITNINADTVTLGLVRKIKFDKVIFIIDKEGVIDKNGKKIDKLTVKQIEGLINEGVVTEGMIPKLSAIKEMFRYKIDKVVVTNSLVQQGTLIVP